MYRFAAIDPVQFKVGDIVEIQMTVTVVPACHDTFKHSFQLRSLALLDSSFSCVSAPIN
jgi:hypothetical protein